MARSRSRDGIVWAFVFGFVLGWRIRPKQRSGNRKSVQAGPPHDNAAEVRTDALTVAQAEMAYWLDVDENNTLGALQLLAMDFAIVVGGFSVAAAFAAAGNKLSGLWLLGIGVAAPSLLVSMYEAERVLNGPSTYPGPHITVEIYGRLAQLSGERAVASLILSMSTALEKNAELVTAGRNRLRLSVISLLVVPVVVVTAMWLAIICGTTALVSVSLLGVVGIVAAVRNRLRSRGSG